MSSRHTNLNVSFTAADVKRLHENAAAALPAGCTVITGKDTARIRRNFAENFDTIAAAGVSGMGIKDGVIRNDVGYRITAEAF